MQPVETDFFDFDPAIAHRLEAALLESLAVTVAVEQGEAAVQRTWREQRDEIAHGEIPCEGDCCEECQRRVTQPCMSDDICVTGAATRRLCQSFKQSLRDARSRRWRTAILPACLCLILEK